MTSVGKSKGIFFIRFAKFTLNLINPVKASSLGLLAANLGAGAVSAQICLDLSGDRHLESALEPYPPTQRVGNEFTVCRDRHLTNRSTNQLMWALPTEFTEIAPFEGETHQLANHEGLDFIHTDQSLDQVIVRSAADGIVVYKRHDCPQSQVFGDNLARRDCGGDWGNHVVIKHPNGLFTRYAHLAPDSISVVVGQRVSIGQELGKMGNSGRSDTRHLHFELGVAIKVDPCAPAQSFKYVYDPIILFCNSAIASSHQSSQLCSKLIPRRRVR